MKFMSFVSMAIFYAFFRIISLLPAAGTFVLYGLATLGFCLLFAARRLRTLDKEDNLVTMLSR